MTRSTRRSVIGLVARGDGRGPAGRSCAASTSRVWASARLVVAGMIVAGVGAIVGIKTFVSYSLGDDLAVKAFVALTLAAAATARSPADSSSEYWKSPPRGTSEPTGGTSRSSYFCSVVLLVAPAGIFTRTRERVV